MKNNLIACAVAACLATPAFAGTCGQENDADIPLFETAKAAFLNADFRSFSRIAGSYFADLDENYDTYFGQLEQIFPDGFERCETILQRREAPAFFQDLILFFPKGYDTPMAVLLIGAKVEGEMRMIEFNYNTSISGVLEELK